MFRKNIARCTEASSSFCSYILFRPSTVQMTSKPNRIFHRHVATRVTTHDSIEKRIANIRPSQKDYRGNNTFCYSVFNEQSKIWAFLHPSFSPDGSHCIPVQTYKNRNALLTKAQYHYSISRFFPPIHQEASVDNVL